MIQVILISGELITTCYLWHGLNKSPMIYVATLLFEWEAGVWKNVIKWYDGFALAEREQRAGRWRGAGVERRFRTSVKGAPRRQVVGVWRVKRHELGLSAAPRATSWMCVKINWSVAYSNNLRLPWRAGRRPLLRNLIKRNNLNESPLLISAIVVG